MNNKCYKRILYFTFHVFNSYIKIYRFIDKHIWSNNQNYYLDFILQNSDDISNCDGNDESKVVQEQ